MQAPVSRITFNERGLSHPWIVEHEAPLKTDEVQSGVRFICEIMGLQLKTADKRRYSLTGFWSWRSIISPALFKGTGYCGALLGRLRQICFDSPCVSILRVESCSLVVDVEPVLVIPEFLIGGDLDFECSALPFCCRGGILKLYRKCLRILKNKV